MDQQGVSLVCDLSAVPDQERYSQLVQRLRAAITGGAELPDGWSYSVEISALTIAELGEWIGLERHCCAFLHFDVALSAGDRLCWLTLTGPAGAKEILEREFPL